MAIGWMTALKMVPWGDVIESAPALVNGAKRLFTSSRTPATPVPEQPVAPSAGPPTVDVAHLKALLEQGQLRIEALESEQRDTAALIKSLAEQQQKVVGAIEVLGKRSSLLIGFCVVLAVTCMGLAAALFSR